MLIRNLDENDKDDIFNWRNDKISRSMFFESSVVSKKSHDKWFFKSIKDKSKKIYIGEHKKKKIDKSNSMFTEIAINMITATLLLFYTWREFVRNLNNLREEFDHLNYIESNNTNYMY